MTIRQLLLLLAVLSTATAASVAVAWSGSTLFTTRNHLIYLEPITMITSSAAKTGSVSVTWSPVYSTVPQMCYGVFKIAATPSNAISFDLSPGTINTTGVTISYTVGSTTSINSLQINILSFQNSTGTAFLNVNSGILFTASLFSTINSTIATGIRSAIMMTNYTFYTGLTVNIANTIKLLVFFNGITMQCNSGSIFNLTLSAAFINTNSYTITISTGNTTTITALRFARLTFDQTAVEATQTTFLDSDVVTALNSNWTQLKLTTVVVWKNLTNFFIGGSSMVYSSTASANYFYNSTTLTCSGGLTFQTLAFSYWNYRYRSCPTGYPYFSSLTSLCYNVCDPYWYPLTTTMVCLPCYYSCFACSNTTSTSNCTSCSLTDFRTLVGTNCLCNSGYFDNGVSICVPCSYTCTTCSNTTACLTCSTSNFRTLMSSQCPCNSGYIDNGTATCIACSAVMTGCSVCTSLTVCISCLSGYYPSGTVCLACSQYCTSCTSSTTCTICKPTFVIKNGNCTCSAGFYASASAGACLTCSSALVGCSNCTSASVCTTCISASNFNLTGATCICASGYYLFGTSCLVCPNGCYTCTSATVCTACLSAANFILVGSSCVCDALGGYALSSGSCQLCSSLIPGCSACSSSTTCTQCMTGLSQTLTLIPSGSCSCPVGYTFDTGVTDCVPCATCCLLGEYYDSSNGVCSPCTVMAPNCTACTSLACTSCSSGNYISSGACYVCSSTIPGCLSCSDSSTCSTCDTSNNYLLLGYSCQCVSGYTLDPSSNCVPCSATLPGCLSCTDQNSCMNCDANFEIDPNNSSQCVCIYGYYLSAGSCVACSIGCLNCSSATVCSACNSSLFLSLAGNTCVCNSGYYLSGTICQLCSTITGCLTCVDAATCNSCDSSTNFVSSGSTCTCAVGYYLSAGTCLACPAGCTSCDSTGTTCIGCDTAQGLTLIAGVCVCGSGNYLPAGGNTCANCITLFQWCVDCTEAACTSCQLPAIISGSVCACPVGYYSDGTSCQHCSTLSPGCTQCTAGGCSVCDSSLFFQASGNSCSCQTGYALSGSSCSTCPSVISGCLDCTDASTCITCDAANNFVINGAICVCASGYFLNTTGNCQACASTLTGCNTCSNSSACTACLTASNFSLQPDNTCACKPSYVMSGSGCVSCLISCVCYGYQFDSNGACSPFCSDSIAIVPNEQCDDGNLLAGDGCSPTCTAEPGYTCTIDSSLRSTCTKDSSQQVPIVPIVLISTIKNTTGNSVTFTFEITPALPAFDTMDFSQAITSDLSNSSKLFFNYSNGMLTVTAQYNSSIQGQNISLKFDPALVSSQFSGTSSYNMTFSVDPDNNIPAVFYQDSVYQGFDTMNILAKVVTFSSIGMFTVGLFTAKFIGVEMIGVVQIAFIGLMMINDVPPLLSTLASMGQVNGYNSAFESGVSSMSTSQSLPNRISSLQYRTSLAQNLNYTLTILAIPLLVSLALYIVSKLSKQDEIRQQKFYKWSMLALNQWGFTAVLFLVYHFVASVMLFGLYGGQMETTLLALSLADALLVGTTIIATAVLFKLKAEYFGDYKVAFKGDSLSQYHYWIVLGSRIVLACAIVGLNSIAYVGFACSAIPLISIIYLIFKRPYNLMYNNLRAICNELIMLLVLSIYGYYRAFVDPTSQDAFVVSLFPIVLVALLLTCIVMNSVFMIKYWFDQRSLRKIQKKDEEEAKLNKLEPELNAQFMQEAKLRLATMLGSNKAHNRFHIPTIANFGQAERLQIQNDIVQQGNDKSQQLKIRLSDKLLNKRATPKALPKEYMPEQEAQGINQAFDEI